MLIEIKQMNNTNEEKKHNIFPEPRTLLQQSNNQTIKMNKL